MVTNGSFDNVMFSKWRFDRLLLESKSPAFDKHQPVRRLFVSLPLGAPVNLDHPTRMWHTSAPIRI
jgi:hypothetical protein